MKRSSRCADVDKDSILVENALKKIRTKIHEAMPKVEGECTAEDENMDDCLKNNSGTLNNNIESEAAYKRRVDEEVTKKVDGLLEALFEYFREEAYEIERRTKETLLIHIEEDRRAHLLSCLQNPAGFGDIRLSYAGNVFM